MIKRLISIISIIGILSGLTVFPATAQDSERKVFSGNNWNEGDEYIYTSILGEASLVNADNTPVYSYDASEDTLSERIDKNNTYLTGGHLFRYDGDYAVGSQWDLKKPVVTVWNLNTEAVLDEVDVWSTVSDGITDRVIVYVSNDGAEWEQVNDGTVIGTSYNDYGSSHIYRYPVKFTPVTAQYVKVEVYPPQDTGTYHKCYVNEIVIFGYETKFTPLKSVVNKYSDAFEQIESIAVSGADELKKALSDGKALLNSSNADEAAILSAAEAIKTAYGKVVYSKTPVILTGDVKRYNNEGNVTHDFYPGLTEYKTMSVISAKKADSSGTDITESADILINGKAIRHDAGAFWGAYAKKATNIKPFTITLESDKEVYFTGVDLYTWVNNGPRYVKSLRVEVSDDNVNYKTVATVQNNFNGDTSGMISTDGGLYGQILSTTDMVPVKGKYIRLTATHGGLQAIIDEIAIKGFPVDDIILSELSEKISDAKKYIAVKEIYKAEDISNLQAILEEVESPDFEKTEDNISVAIIDLQSIMDNMTATAEHKVFSGNNWNDGDNYIYESLVGETGLVNAGNTPVYSYDVNGDTEPAGNDKNKIYLTGGHLFRYDGDYSVGSKWNFKKPVVTVWNLNTEAVLDRVDVWSTVSDGITDRVIVYVSNDGAEWEQVNDGTVIGTSYNNFGSSQIYRYPVKFAPVTAQYVKVEVYPPRYTGTYHKCYVNEIGIFGYETKFTPLKSVVNKYSDAFEQIESIAVSGADELKTAISDGKALLNSGSADEAAIRSAAEAIKTAYGNIVYSKTPGLLTGDVKRYNNEGNVTHDFYPGLTEYKTMSVISAKKADSSGTDVTENAAVLINGKAIRHDAGALWGEYADNETEKTNIKPFTITLESDTEVYFTGVDLYAWANSDPKCVRSLRVEVSDDNVNYKTVETISSKFNGDTSGMIYTDGGLYGQILSTTDMVPVKGKYIRLTATHGGLQAIIDEIAVKGFPVSEGAEFKNMSYTAFDENDMISDSLDNAGRVDVAGTLVNHFSKRTGRVFTAAYSGNNLTAVSASDEFTIFPEAEHEFSISVVSSGGFEQNTKLVSYFWDNDMTPYTEPEVLDSIIHKLTVSDIKWITDGDEASSSAFVNSWEKLFDGNESSSVSSVGDSVHCANMKIEFDDIMQLRKVKINAMCASDSYLTGFDIYVSKDGINYEYAASKENTFSKTYNRILPLTLDIPGVIYAKFIKIVAKGESALEIGEITVTGNYPYFSKERLCRYSYSQEVPFPTSDDVVNADINNNALTDKSGIASNDEYICVIYEADDYCSVEDITVYGSYSGCEMLTSLDGMNYQTMGFYPCVNGETKAIGRANRNAKYIKLVFRGPSELYEVIVNVRKLYESNQASSEQIPIKAELKPNNILYLDWSGYNAALNEEYSVYIEPKKFTSTDGLIPKKIYVKGEKKDSTSEQFCIYAGMAPESDYYAAIVPKGKASKLTATKLHTNSALGDNSLAGIFCINEYANGGGAHVAHEDEEANFQIKLKLIQDLEVLSKTRFFENTADVFDAYAARGLGNQSYAWEWSSIPMMNSYGIYSFAYENEPELKVVDDTEKYYLSHPDEYAELMKKYYTRVKAECPAASIVQPSTCGTDTLGFVEDLYEAAPDLGDYYDVFDVHAYCKKYEGMWNLDDNMTAEQYSVPEHIFAKTDKVRNLLNKYNDGDKPVIFTEIGWSTHSNPENKDTELVTKQQHANYVARCYLISALCDIKNVFLYAFQDEGYETTDDQWQYGIVDWYGNPKPAYYSYYVLGKLLKNAEVVGRVETIEHPDYGAVFYDREKDMYLTALWNNSGSQSMVSVNSNDSVLQKIDMYGNTEMISAGNVSIGSSPIYIYSSDIPTVTSM